jgi:hypothetical protein
MILYDDYEPKKITLHAISENGTQISMDAFITPDEKHLLPITISEASTKHHARIAYSTHRRCTACNEIFRKDELLYADQVCRPCRDAKEYKEYLTKPLVKLEFPIYINDDFISDEDELNDYILDREITSEDGLKVYNTEQFSFNADLLSWLDDRTGDFGYEESLHDLLSLESYNDLVDLEMEINSLMREKLYPLYDADKKTRCSIKEYIIGSV